MENTLNHYYHEAVKAYVFDGDRVDELRYWMRVGARYEQMTGEKLHLDDERGKAL